MARTKNNSLTRGTSGKIGNLVFTLDGRMRLKPDTSKRVWSQLQKQHLERVDESKRYARFATSDPELNEFYALKAAKIHGLGAWHMAISDYYYPPRIASADFREFKCKMGNRVSIYACDNFEVKKVMVSFASLSSEIIENGYADPEPGNRTWHYLLKADIEIVPGMTVIIRAMDIAGNITSETLTWPFDCRNVIEFACQCVTGYAKKRVKSQLRNWNG